MKRRRLLNHVVLPVVLLSVGAGQAAGAEYFISPTGRSNAAGTINDPWSISALASSSLGAPGDTFWMRGGDYVYPDRSAHQNGFMVRLNRGSSGAPITVRNYDGERVTVDGGMRFDGTRNLRIWGLEFIVSENLTESRTTYGPGTDRPGAQGTFSELGRPWGSPELAGENVSLINSFVHHNTVNGIASFSRHNSGEIYGNISYENGFYSQYYNNCVGHGIYCATKYEGQKNIENNMFFANANASAQWYGSYDPGPQDLINTTIRNNFFQRGPYERS
ncbi:MAG: hypothetical protein ACYS5V_03575, partial [Planctomycetota bacterium]